MAPGRMELTVMPKGPTSRERVLAQEATAQRTELETPRKGIGALTEEDKMVRIRPYCFSFMPGTHRRVNKTAERRWLLMAASNSSSLASRTGPPLGPPVLWIK